MDGLTVAAIIMSGGFVPTWIALAKLNYKMAKVEQRLDDLNRYKLLKKKL